MKYIAPLFVFLLVACGEAHRDFGFTIEILRSSRVGDSVEVRARQDVDFSADAREALRHGVPIRLRVDLALRESGSWSDDHVARLHYEISYLPLSDHYQVSGPTVDPAANGENALPGSNSTYPRLRHALAAISELNYRFEDVRPESGPLQLRARSRIDRSGMPGPMQLPVFLSPDWHHDSGWVVKPVEPSEGGNTG